MKLHWSPRSPFVRKVNIVLEECGLPDAVERVRSVAVFAAPPNPDILNDNPLGKIPVLITDDNQKLFDSSDICECLITLARREDLLPWAPALRIRHLRWQALGTELLQTPFGLGHIAVICALGQLDFRYAGCGWQSALPSLAAWYKGIAIRHSVASTAIVDDDAVSNGPTDSVPAFTYATKH